MEGDKMNLIREVGEREFESIICEMFDKYEDLNYRKIFDINSGSVIL